YRVEVHSDGDALPHHPIALVEKHVHRSIAEVCHAPVRPAVMIQVGGGNVLWAVPCCEFGASPKMTGVVVDPSHQRIEISRGRDQVGKSIAVYVRGGNAVWPEHSVGIGRPEDTGVRRLGGQDNRAEDGGRGYDRESSANASFPATRKKT